MNTMEKPINKKTLEKLKKTYDIRRIAIVMEKLHQICHVLGEKEDKKGVTLCIFSLWSKANSLINDNPIGDEDYHPNSAIYDVAYDIMEIMEDVQTYAQDIVSMLRPLIRLNPEFEEDGCEENAQED